MKKKYTKKQIQEAINYWKKQIKIGNYKKINESSYDNYGYGKDDDLLKDQEFKADFVKGLSQNSPFKFDENTSNGEIVGWLCKAFDCKDINELIGELYKLIPDRYEVTGRGIESWGNKDYEINIEYTTHEILDNTNDLISRLIEDCFPDWFDDNEIIDKDDLIKCVKHDIPDVVKGIVDSYTNRLASRDELVD